MFKERIPFSQYLEYLFRQITNIFSFVLSPNQLAIIPLVSKVTDDRPDEDLNISFVFIPVIVLHEALLPVPVPPRTQTHLNNSYILGICILKNISSYSWGKVITDLTAATS